MPYSMYQKNRPRDAFSRYPSIAEPSWPVNVEFPSVRIFKLADAKAKK